MTDNIPVELREDDGVQRLHATLVQEGRPSARRVTPPGATEAVPEVFAPGSVVWPVDGVAIRARHGQPTELRAMPVRTPDGSIKIAVKATDRIINAVKGGLRSMSVEFKPLEEQLTGSGVREHLRALVHSAALADEATAVYGQGAAEVRESKARKLWL